MWPRLACPRVPGGGSCPPRASRHMVHAPPCAHGPYGCTLNPKPEAPLEPSIAARWRAGPSLPFRRPGAPSGTPRSSRPRRSGTLGRSLLRGDARARARRGGVAGHWHGLEGGPLRATGTDSKGGRCGTRLAPLRVRVRVAIQLSYGTVSVPPPLDLPSAE